jgi:hypothetical protein
LQSARGAWRLFGLLAAAIVLFVGCSAETGEQRTLSKRERDSTLAASPLPGAGAVGKAMEISDSAAARSQRSLPDDP